MIADGFATYRLRVRLPDQPGAMALYLPYAHTNYQLWIDGELFASNGVVGRSHTEAKPQFRPEIAYFTPEGDEIDIVVHVSNFDFRNGGLPRRLELGLADAITMKQRRLEALSATMFGAALVASFFFVVTYLLRRENLSDAFFGLFLFCIAARVLVTGDHLLSRLAPNLSWETELTIEYLTSFLMVEFFLYYLHHLFPNEASWFVEKLCNFFVFASLAVSLTMPGRVSSRMMPTMMLLFAALCFYLVWIGVKAMARKRPEARLFFGAQLAFAVGSLTTLLRYAGFAKLPDLIPASGMLAIVSQGLVLGLRSARAHRQAIQLAAENAEMLQKTEWQLEKLKEYRRLMTLREENVRRRIADSLHGRAQARLLTADRRIEQACETMNANEDKVRGFLEDARDLLAQVREEDIRSTGRQLHPSAVGAGVVGAIESLLHAFEDSYDIRFDVEPSVEAIDQSQRGFPYDLRLGAYRVVEEGLNNILKHAKARAIRASLALDRRDDKTLLKLALADDGIGLRHDQSYPGLGLQTIDARVVDLGGTWTFTGAPGQGATLSVWLPLPSLDPDQTGQSTNAS